MSGVRARATVLYFIVCLAFGHGLSFPLRDVDGDSTLQPSLDYDGTFISGSAARGADAVGLEWLQALDTARTQLSPNPELQYLTMLYQDDSNALQEGPTWKAWWTHNSQGTTMFSLPFLGQPETTWLQRSQDFWFNHQGDGKTADPHGDVGPPGALCDDGGPTYCRFKQGDGQVAIHDWTFEEGLAGALMQAELLLVSRDEASIRHYLPKLRLNSDLMETRRDAGSGLFLVGPAANVVAPSFGGWLLPNGTRAHAFLSGLTITYTAVLERLIEVATLVDDTASAALFALRRDANLASLDRLLSPTGDYFVKSVDPDGTRHGVEGQAVHGYLEATVNHDAIAWGVANASLAAAIMARLTKAPLRPHTFVITNAPSLDDMEEPAAPGLWQFGRWVNGGAWSSCEGRMIAAYFRLGMYDDALASMQAMLGFARQFRMDNPLVDFGAAVYQPDEAINLTADNFAVPASLLRGLLRYTYTAAALILTVRRPPSVEYFCQKFPVRFGRFELFISVQGAGENVSAVTVNGRDVTQFAGDRVELRYSTLAAIAGAGTSQESGANARAGPAWPGAGLVVTISMDVRGVRPEVQTARRDAAVAAAKGYRRDGLQLHAPRSALWRRRWGSQAVGAVAPGSTPCLLPTDLQAQLANATQFHTGALALPATADRYEPAHAAHFIDACEAAVARCVMLQHGVIAPLRNATSQAAADASYLSAASALYRGLANVMVGYAHSVAPTEALLWSLWTGEDRHA